MQSSLQKVLAEELNSKLRVFRCRENNYFSYEVFEHLALCIHNIKTKAVVSVYLQQSEYVLKAH